MLRVTHQLSQNEMIKRLNVSQSVYSRYENDEKEVSENDAFVKCVAMEFDVTRKSLLGDDDESNSDEASNTIANPTAFGSLKNYYFIPIDLMERILEMINMPRGK